MQIGVAIPQLGRHEAADSAWIAEKLRWLDGVGFHSQWLTDPGLGYANSLATTPLLAFAAGVTRRAMLGAAVYVLPLRSPVRLAQELATIDVLSSGRLIVGVALGGKPHEYRAYGITDSARLARFEAAVATLRAVWRGDLSQVQGPSWSVPTDQAIAPRPVQDDGPKIWFGGRSQSAARRASELGDGWIGAGSMSTARHQVLVGHVTDGLEASGRFRRDFDVAKRVYIAVGRDTSALREKMRASMSEIYGRPELAEEVALFGTHDRCIEELTELHESGTDLLILHPLFDLEEQFEAIAELALRLKS